MKNNNNKGKVLSINIKNSPTKQRPNLSPLQNNTKNIDLVLNEITNSIFEIEIKKNSTVEMDSIKDNIWKINMLVGVLKRMADDIERDPLEESLVGEVNRLRQENNNLKNALNHHKKVASELGYDNSNAIDLITQALEALVKY
jgi:regulator of replication initiation timing